MANWMTIKLCSNISRLISSHIYSTKIIIQKGMQPSPDTMQKPRNTQKHFALPIARLQSRFASLPSDGALYQSVGVGLRSINFSIFASILEAFMPAQIWILLVRIQCSRVEILTDFEVVLVW